MSLSYYISIWALNWFNMRQQPAVKQCCLSDLTFSEGKLKVQHHCQQLWQVWTNQLMCFLISAPSVLFWKVEQAEGNKAYFVVKPSPEIFAYSIIFIFWMLNLSCKGPSKIYYLKLFILLLLHFFNITLLLRQH